MLFLIKSPCETVGVGITIILFSDEVVADEKLAKIDVLLVKEYGVLNSMCIYI